MINKAICCQCVLWLKSKIAKISTLKGKRIAKSLKFDPVNNSSLKVVGANVEWPQNIKSKGHCARMRSSGTRVHVTAIFN